MNRVRSTLWAVFGIILSLHLVGNATGSKFKLNDSVSIPDPVKAKFKDRIKANFSFDDKVGRHTLVLTKDSTRSKDGSEKIEIQAEQYLSKGPTWNLEWAIKDYQVCNGLDIAADFFTSLTSVSDLDENGVAESSVAYHISCSGDVEPETIKVVMRQGKEKFAIRGESLVQIKGMPPEGGTFVLDRKLEAKPVFKEHLLAIWKKAAGV
ncbi:MAG: hypothetical protein ABI036_10545 [Fibrobacteria bacterium]